MARVVLIGAALMLLALDGLAADSRISLLRNGSTTSVAGYLKTPIAQYCENSPLEVQSAHREDRSLGRGYRDPRNPSRFYQSQILKIGIQAADGECDGDCRIALEQALVKSLALWRSGCSRCRSEKLIAVVVNGSTWLNNVTIDKWLFALENGHDKAEIDPKAHARMSLRPLGFQPIVDFRRVDTNLMRARMCDAANQFASGSELAGVICGRSQGSCRTNSCMDFPLRLGTSQGCTLTGRLACGSPDGEVALNTSSFSYTARIETDTASREVRVGRGRYSYPLLAVLTHEVGHWFGLDHETEDARVMRVSVMQSALDPDMSWCITAWNLQQLDNAVDEEWDFRLKQPHGLVPKR